MSARDLVKMEIDGLSDNMVEFVKEFVIFLKRYQINNINNINNINYEENTDRTDKIKEGYQILLKYKGTLKREIDIKKERLEALDEKYDCFS